MVNLFTILKILSKASTIVGRFLAGIWPIVRISDTFSKSLQLSAFRYKASMRYKAPNGTTEGSQGWSEAEPLGTRVGNFGPNGSTHFQIEVSPLGSKNSSGSTSLRPWLPSVVPLGLNFDDNFQLQ